LDKELKKELEKLEFKQIPAQSDAKVDETAAKCLAIKSKGIMRMCQTFSRLI